jgi:aspartyl-tRNA(Asn)/glutamyl-tRNA(Gln) amidotransferase subunit B
MYIKGNSGEWEYVIGLEIHAQITSESKLFSNSSTEFASAPNSQVSFVDAAFPGMLPVLNEHCVHQTIKTGLAINAQINKYSTFDRKNYFYPDLPQGYQISQFYNPIVTNGNLSIQIGNIIKNIRINRIHIEQDAGKSMHDQNAEYSLIDLNRSGIGLMEIVTEPDLSSPEEAAEFVRKLRILLRYVGSCSGDMEKGAMRCDANISVRRVGDINLGTRCEIKNVNSIRNIVKAIEFEAARQVELLESGGKIDQETRLFDASTGETRMMRLKEESHDYRYFPDPDLLPVILTDELIENIAKTMQELPDAKIDRYISEFGLSKYDAEIIVSDEEIAGFFEKTIKLCNAKMVANWLTSELFGLLNKNSISISLCKITPEMLGKMIKLIEDDIISGKIAKTIFEIMFETGDDPEKIIEEKGLKQVSDDKLILSVIHEVIEENPESVTEYRNGKDRLFGFFVGQVMKKTSGNANPSIVNKLLKELL